MVCRFFRFADYSDVSGIGIPEGTSIGISPPPKARDLETNTDASNGVSNGCAVASLGTVP